MTASSCTITEAIELKNRLELAILKQIEGFEKHTGIRVQAVRLDAYLEHQPISTRYLELDITLPHTAT